jgi:hypothetical protein
VDLAWPGAVSGGKDGRGSFEGEKSVFWLILIHMGLKM